MRSGFDWRERRALHLIFKPDSDDGEMTSVDGATAIQGDGRAARRQRQVRMGRSERRWQRGGYCRGVRCTWGKLGF
ncbi:hypothetical protein E1A91_D11G376300v1 [Gossypium mustelinum]|uniref:Uncharacterized protein n=2 Tax=Gossypium TaxID=3633 RepID=A0A5D2T1N7_GOSMU|nr:hypothetical protein ES288_D11G386600v1 [Gossypium darwinii]TYI58655.1 hypothetical protein E1A91_D11G376300v1 [Gossypium mustelinum]